MRASVCAEAGEIGFYGETEIILAVESSAVGNA
jgi:hypothetical protein